MPGESLLGKEDFAVSSNSYSQALHKLPVLRDNEGLQLRARVDHTDENGQRRRGGDLWQVEGPTTYRPTAEAVSNSILKL